MPARVRAPATFASYSNWATAAAGYIVERLGGSVATGGAGVFKGNSEHQLPGSCSNAIVRFEGSACVLI